MEKILISGYGGLLGRNLGKLFLEKGYQVFGISHSNIFKSNGNLTIINIDFNSDWDLSILPIDIDVVIHLAQSSNYRDFPQSAIDIFRVNLESTAKLLDFCRKTGVKKFIYASSGGIYKESNEALKENAPIFSGGQLGYYLGTKAASEILLQNYSAIFKVITLRPFFIYGPNQNPNMLMPRLFKKVLYGEKIKINGFEGIKINPIHVDDASMAIYNCLNINLSATFNIAGPEILSIKDICSLFGKYLEKKPIYEIIDNIGHDIIADISYMKDKLFIPKKKIKYNISDFQK